MNRDQEIKDVAAQLEELLDDLRENVAALTEILAPPPDPPGAAPEETQHEPA